MWPWCARRVMPWTGVGDGGGAVGGLASDVRPCLRVPEVGAGAGAGAGWHWVQAGQAGSGARRDPAPPEGACTAAPPPAPPRRLRGLESERAAGEGSQDERSGPGQPAADAPPESTGPRPTAPRPRSRRRHLHPPSLCRSPAGHARPALSTGRGASPCARTPRWRPPGRCPVRGPWRSPSPRSATCSPWCCAPPSSSLSSGT